MPTSLQLTSLDAAYGARPLFQDLTLGVGPRDVVALVGPNGSGKSTLLRIVAGLHQAEGGSVDISPPGSTVGYLPQQAPLGGESLAAYARRRTGVTRAEQELEAATAALVEQRPGADDGYAAAMERWLGLGGADLDHRLPELAARIGLAVDLDRPLGSLSGGQAARACLLSVLASRFDLLLLDEPTNDLDATGMALIRDYVTGLDAPVLVASHDRGLIDDVATTVVELDIRQARVGVYPGGWSDYEQARDLVRRASWEDYERYADQRDALTEQARRRTDWASKGARAARRSDEPDKHLRHRKVARAQAQDARAAMTRRAVERLERVDQPRKEWELRYRVREADPSAAVVVGLTGAVVRRGGFTLGPVTVEVGRHDRIALVGDNGSGKSTLVAALLGRLPLDRGRRHEGTRVRWGLIDQQRSELDVDTPVVDRVRDLLSIGAPAQEWPPDEVRTLLAKFGLGAEHITRPCSTLSVGERTRALLAVLQGHAVNTLVLDEPTNHLDVQAIEQLEQALAQFEGTVLLVTHDRPLTERVGITRTWALTAGALSEQSPTA